MQRSLFGNDDAKPISHAMAPDLGLRPYQQAARDGVARVHAEHRGALVVLPTGTGKTRTFGAVAWDHKLRGSKVLVLCPTIVLCRQMYDDMRKLGLSVSIEQASNFAVRPLPDVTVASVATMRGDRLRTFRPDDFGLVCADECHRSVSDSYIEIFAHFASAKRLGLTATPDRTDGVSLANVFDAVAYEMSMLDAIDQGWLVPLKFMMAQTDFDPRAIRTIAGEVSAGSVAAELVASGALHQAAVTLSELSAGERCVAFLPTVAASQAFVAELNARHERSPSVTQYAVHIDAGTPEGMRDSVFTAFRHGACSVLSNVGILTEGWDAPHATVIALLNPTKSRSRLAQMIGRGTRLHDGKDHCLVIDFCHGRLKAGRLASPADALAGEMLPDEINEHIGESGDLAQAIHDAKGKAAELEELRLRREEIAREKAARRDCLKDFVKPREFVYGVQSVNMHAVLGLFGRSRDIISDLEQHGVDVPRAEADRKSKGMCSVKQANLLARFGMNPNVTWKVAADAISALKSNDWRVSNEMRLDRRFW